MKKILMSAGMIVFVGAIVAGATGAFFSDSETSTGNVLAAGSIDLGVDNTSYYNGQANTGTTWGIDYDIDTTEFPGDNPSTTGTVENGYSLNIPRLFLNFNDLKPGDYGEDTISLHVTNNASWLCGDVTVTRNADETCNEPENDVVGGEGGTCGAGDANTNGDLLGELDFMYWADDGDNVLETGETPTITTGIFGANTVGLTQTLSLVDSNDNVFGTPGQPLPVSANPVYLGKAWCFGTIAAAADDQDGFGNVKTPAGDNNGIGGAGTPEDGGYTCSGASGVTNSSQTDVVRADISFRAEQARHNGAFQCVPQ